MKNLAYVKALLNFEGGGLPLPAPNINTSSILMRYLYLELESVGVEG